MRLGAGDARRVATRQQPDRSYCVRDRGTSTRRLQHPPALPRLRARSGHGFFLVPLSLGPGVRVGVLAALECPRPLSVGEGLDAFLVERGLPRCLSPALGQPGWESGKPDSTGRRDLRDDGLFATSKEAMTPTRPRTSSHGGMAQAGHGWPAVARWSHGWRNRAMRRTPVGRRPRPEPVPPTPLPLPWLWLCLWLFADATSLQHPGRASDRASPKRGERIPRMRPAALPGLRLVSPLSRGKALVSRRQ